MIFGAITKGGDESLPRHFVCLEILVFDLNVVKIPHAPQQRLPEPSFNQWCNQPPNSIAGITPVKESPS